MRDTRAVQGPPRTTAQTQLAVSNVHGQRPSVLAPLCQCLLSECHDLGRDGQLVVPGRYLLAAEHADPIGARMSAPLRGSDGFFMIPD